MITGSRVMRVEVSSLKYQNYNTDIMRWQVWQNKPLTRNINCPHPLNQSSLLSTSRVQTGNKFNEPSVLYAIFTLPKSTFILFRGSPSGQIKDVLLVPAKVSMGVRWGDSFWVVWERSEKRKQRGQDLLKALTIVSYLPHLLQSNLYISDWGER